jgi:hypothetical protein
MENWTSPDAVATLSELGCVLNRTVGKLANVASWRERRPPSGTFANWFVRSFYFLMSLLIVGIVTYGFSQTITTNLIHPHIPRPTILYVHAAMFFGWVILFTAQTALVQTRNIQWHRRLGRFGFVLGIFMPPVGIATSLVMARFNILHHFETPDQAAAFLAVPINDMIDFSAAFALAIWWRRKAEFHRRLMLMATCCLLAAAFARLPFITIDAVRWYGGVDLLVLLGVMRDLVVNRRIHPVYIYGLPLFMAGQVVAMTVFLKQAPIWLAIAYRLIDQ